MVTINQPIVKSEVVRPDPPSENAAPLTPVAVGKPLVRPRDVDSKTRKIKPPEGDHAYYVTVGWVHDGGGKRRLCEVFIATQDGSQSYLLTALSRLASATLRDNPNPGFLIDEWKGSMDPRGGYWEGRKYHPGLLYSAAVFMEELLAGPPAPISPVEEPPEGTTLKAQETPKKAQCSSCKEWAVVFSGGCDKCQACGFSKLCSE